MQAALERIIHRLIVCEGVDTFLFGSKSRFNELCYELVTVAKESYPYIKRVYVRAAHPVISEEYRAYLLQNYEDTYYPERVRGAGRAAYVQRNCAMIDSSLFCIVYYDECRAPATRRSGTALALAYARRCGRCIQHLLG